MSNTSSVVSGTAILDFEVKPFDANAAAVKLVKCLDRMDTSMQFMTIDSLPQDIHIVGKSDLGRSRLNGTVGVELMPFDDAPDGVSWTTLDSNEPNVRRSLSAKEKAKRKLKNKAVKAARKKNRP